MESRHNEREFIQKFTAYVMNRKKKKQQPTNIREIQYI